MPVEADNCCGRFMTEDAVEETGNSNRSSHIWSDAEHARSGSIKRTFPSRRAAARLRGVVRIQSSSVHEIAALPAETIFGRAGDEKWNSAGGSQPLDYVRVFRCSRSNAGNRAAHVRHSLDRDALFDGEWHTQQRIILDHINQRGLGNDAIGFLRIIKRVVESVLDNGIEERLNGANSLDVLANDDLGRQLERNKSWWDLERRN